MASTPLPAESSHHFTPTADDWGFSEFMTVDQLTKDGFLLNGDLHIKVWLKVHLEEKYTGVSRQRTGYVGLKNQVRQRQRSTHAYMRRCSLLRTRFPVSLYLSSQQHPCCFSSASRTWPFLLASDPSWTQTTNDSRDD
jgi:hypothetical protein